MIINTTKLNLYKTQFMRFYHNMDTGPAREIRVFRRNIRNKSFLRDRLPRIRGKLPHVPAKVPHNIHNT